MIMSVRMMLSEREIAKYGYLKLTAMGLRSIGCKAW